MARTKDLAGTRSMFMDTLRIEAGKDLVHVGLMENDPVTGARPEVDGETLSITLPLSQFEPIMDQFEAAFASGAYARYHSRRRRKAEGN
jgi:hypothetical protein